MIAEASILERLILHVLYSTPGCKCAQALRLALRPFCRILFRTLLVSALLVFNHFLFWLQVPQTCLQESLKWKVQRTLLSCNELMNFNLRALLIGRKSPVRLMITKRPYIWPNNFLIHFFSWSEWTNFYLRIIYFYEFLKNRKGTI